MPQQGLVDVHPWPPTPAPLLASCYAPRKPKDVSGASIGSQHPTGCSEQPRKDNINIWTPTQENLID